jgi:hypothetical protein
MAKLTAPQIKQQLTDNGIDFPANATLPALKQLIKEQLGIDADNVQDAPQPTETPAQLAKAKNGKRDMAFAGYGLGIVDIPFGNYDLVDTGKSKNGKMRTAKYSNATGDIVTFYGTDTYPHLWDANNELKETVAFQFDAATKKVYEVETVTNLG